MSALRKTIPYAQERRRHQRVSIALLGRFMLESRHEYPCQATDMSPGGAMIQAPVLGRVGERVIAYFEHIGRVEGKIVRHLDNGFAMSIQATARRRDKIATQLTWLTNRHALGLPEDRRHERIVPRVATAEIALADGTKRVVRLIDVSMSGAGVTADERPPLGEVLMLGRMHARVVRHFEGGFALEFRHPLTNSTFDANITF